jgi:hypothetical protein
MAMFEVCGARAGSSAAAAPILPVDCRSERGLNMNKWHAASMYALVVEEK